MCEITNHCLLDAIQVLSHNYSMWCYVKIFNRMFQTYRRRKNIEIELRKLPKISVFIATKAKWSKLLTYRGNVQYSVLSKAYMRFCHIMKFLLCEAYVKLHPFTFMHAYLHT